MVQQTTRRDSDLAAALLDVVPKVLRKLGADVPLEAEACSDPAWREMAEVRATPGQLSLLGVLVEHERCMMQELATHLGVAPSTVTAMVKRLLAQGYVERSRDDIDWRAVWITPTERGRRAVEVFDRARLASLQRRLAQLSRDEYDQLMSALPALRHLMETNS